MSRCETCRFNLLDLKLKLLFEKNHSMYFVAVQIKFGSENGRLESELLVSHTLKPRYKREIKGDAMSAVISQMKRVCV